MIGARIGFFFLSWLTMNPNSPRRSEKQGPHSPCEFCQKKESSFIVPKPDGRERIVVDYRPINSPYVLQADASRAGMGFVLSSERCALRETTEQVSLLLGHRRIEVHTDNTTLYTQVRVFEGQKDDVIAPSGVEQVNPKKRKVQATDFDGKSDDEMSSDSMPSLVD